MTKLTSDNNFNMQLTLGNFVLIFTFIDIMEAFYMKGTSESYAKYPPWQPCLNGSFELEFKTSQPSGLIMYTDDKGYYDFFELKLLRGSMQLILSLGTEKMRFLIERSLNDSQWHKVSINRSGRNVTLTVDNIPFPREYHSQDQEFGVAGDNSDVFIGGIPLSYRQQRDELTLKTVFQEPHYKGFIRNLLVSDCGRPKYRPPRLDSYDVLDDGMDKCLDPDTNPCQHGGICLTKDQHVQCDCSYTQFEGEFCEKESFQSEVTFHGAQYFFYDLSAGQDMHSTTRDKVDFYFRTQQKTGFLFYTGEMSDYIILALRNGWIVGVVNLGSEDAHLEINRPGYRFDDNQWHHLVLYRNTREVELWVDGIHSTETKITGAYTLLDGTKVYAGGHPDIKQVGNEIGVLSNFKGCMKKIKYTANDVELDLTKMAADGSDHMTIQGDITFDKCKEMVESQPITFTTSESFIRLPHWEVDHLGGTLTFSFQTNEQNGVIMYNSRVKNSDFFAFELWDGYLWFIIDLGSGPTKKRVTQNKVNDGVQHQVILEHLSNSGYIMLDGSRVEYLVSGQSLNLNLEGELYIGGVGDTKQKLPKDLWSGMLGYGYVGCLQDLTLNREKIDLLTVARKTMRSGISGTCRVMEPQCLGQPCYNGGVCKEGWNRFICDCRATSFTGTSCQTVAATLEFDGAQYMKVTLPDESQSEAEDISIRFKTTRSNGLIFVTSSDRTSDKMELYLEEGIVQLDVNINNQRQKFRQKQMSLSRTQVLNDGEWHTVKILRRGERIGFYLDNYSHQESVISLSYTKTFDVKYIVLGSPGPMLADHQPRDPQSLDLGQMSQDGNTMGRLTGFVGSMQQLVFNGNHYFEMADDEKTNKNIELTARFESDQPVFRDAVTFRSTDSYVILLQLNARLQFSIYFKFKTAEPDGLMLFNGGKGQDFIALELQSGYLHFIYNMGDGAERIVVNTIDPLNDDNWHDMTIQRPSKERIILRVDAMNPTVKDLSNSENKFFDLEGRLYVGGVLRSMYNSLPPKVSSRNGYRGCMASVDYNGYKPNLVKNSLSLNDVVESCGGQSSGEMSKCRVDSCHNGGECRPRWRSYTCDCDMTSYTGHTCNQPSTYATFGPGPGMIMYRFPDSNVRDTNEDYLAFGFRTDQNNVRPVILFRVESSTGVDYMEVRLVNGVVFMVYNLGTSDIPVANTFQSGHNDGNYHVVRITRNQANATLQVDNKRPVHKSPAKDSMKVFNDQAFVYVGGSSRPDNGTSPFQGTISGLVLNRVPILDLAAKRDPFIRKTGDVVITPARKQEMQSTESLQVKVYKRRAPTPGHYSNVKHSSNTIKQANLHVRFNSNEESSFKENSVRFGDPNSAFQKTVPRNTLTEGSGNQIINAQDASELFPNYDYDSDISYNLNSISGESLEGSGRKEINPQEHGKVNLAEVPSTVIDSMNIQWYKKLRQRPLPRKHKKVEEALHHEIEFGTVRRRKSGNSDTDWNDINGKFPKDRGKITASKQGIRLQLVPHSTSEHTTPRQGTTPGIIIAAGSGDGDLDCPDDVDQDCLTSESDNGIIKATLTVIRKSTTTIQPTKSTRYDPCEDNDPTCPNGTADLTHDRHAQNKSEESRKEKTTPDGSAQKTPAQSRTDSPTKPNLALIIGIVAGVVIALIILVIALYKFRSRDEGTYKVDETQNFPYLEGKNKQSNGALLGHSQSSKSGKKKDVTEWYV